MKKIPSFDYFNRSVFSVKAKQVRFFNKSETEMTLPLPYSYQNRSSRLQKDAKLFIKILLFFVIFRYERCVYGKSVIHGHSSVIHLLFILQLFMVTYCDVFIRFNYMKILTMMILV